MGLTLLKVQKRCANLCRKEGVKGRKELFAKYSARGFEPAIEVVAPAACP
jgi:hypothetical protein